MLGRLSPEQVRAETLAGEPIVAKLTRAPGNGAAIGGLKVVTENGWFAARPSGTEDVYKIYAESFRGREHLSAIQEEAQAIVKAAFDALTHAKRHEEHREEARAEEGDAREEPLAHVDLAAGEVERGEPEHQRGARERCRRCQRDGDLTPGEAHEARDQRVAHRDGEWRDQQDHGAGFVAVGHATAQRGAQPQGEQRCDLRHGGHLNTEYTRGA
jgi:hypothetical protein